MDAQKIDRLERLLERKLSIEEKERLRRIKDILGIKDNDGIWDILVAMEYQQKYYDELPEKISLAAADIFKELSKAAEKELARGQSRLAENILNQTERVSLKRHVHTWLIWGALTLILLLLYGSLLLWAGYSMGSGQAHLPSLMLKVPVGIILGALCFTCGIFLGFRAAKNFADGSTVWRQHLLAALGCMVPGGFFFSFAVF